MTTNSLSFRLIASAMSWVGVALLIGGFALASLFRDTVERRFDAGLIVVWENLVASVELDDSGRIQLVGLDSDLRFQQTFSGWYWQIIPASMSALGENPGLRSRSLWDQELAVIDLIDTLSYARGFVDGPEGQNLRVVGRQIFLPSADQPYIILVAGDRDELELEIARFNTFLIWSFLALAAGLLIAMLIQIRVGLSPLRDVGRALAAIRTGKAERLDGTFPSEITPLADELNALITTNTETLERSRTQVGNLAHALKTPLSVLANEVREHPGEFANVVSKQTRAMHTHVDHYLARARAAAAMNVLGVRTEVYGVVEDLVRTVERIYQDRDIQVDMDIDDTIAFRGERQDLQELVGNVLDNACKWAAGHVRIRVASLDDATFNVSIEDDGPGLTREEAEQVVQRGTRLDEAQPGSGLGLSIVADITDLYNGRFSLDRSEFGGLKVSLNLPAAAP